MYLVAPTERHAFAASSDRSSVVSPQLRRAFLETLDGLRVLSAEYAAQVEHGLMLWSGGRERAYRRKALVLLEVLRRRDITLNTPPYALAFCRELTFAQHARDMAERRDATASTIAGVEGALKRRSTSTTTAKVRCPNCGGDEVEEVAIQARSADEGMVYRHVCCTCMHQFKYRS